MSLFKRQRPRHGVKRPISGVARPDQNGCPRALTPSLYRDNYIFARTARYGNTCTGLQNNAAGFQEPISIAQQSFNLSLASPTTDGPTASQSLTRIEDTEEKIIQSEVVADAYGPSNPFPAQTPSAVLTRQYLVAEFNWTIGGGFNDRVMFPKALTDITTIQEYLKLFLFFRAGVDIEVRINASPYLYGALLCSWIPNELVSDNVHCGSLIRESGNHPVVISASVQQAAKIHIPWTNPFNYMGLDQPLMSSSSQIGVLYLRELAPLTSVSTDVPDTVHVQVYANFTNLDLAGYLPQTLAPPLSVLQLDAKNNHAQSRVVKQLPPTQPPRTQETQEHAPTGQDPLTATFSQIAPIFKTVTDTFSTLTDLGRKAVSFASLFDKPMTNQSMTYTSQTGWLKDMIHSDGEDPTPKLSLHKNALTSNLSTHMGNPHNVVSLASIFCTPMIRTTHTFLDLDDYILETVHPLNPVLVSTSGVMDYLSTVANVFEMWRGPIRYYFQFFTSPFITCRFLLQVVYTAAIPAISNTGDVPSKIIDVRGDTEYMVEIPYLWDTMWRNVCQGDNFPFLILRPITVPVGPSAAADAAIHCVVWCAGCPTTQFMKLTNPLFSVITPPAQPEPLVLDAQDNAAQTDVRKVFERDFPPIIQDCSTVIEDGYCSPEQILTLDEILKRYYLYPYNSVLPAPGFDNLMNYFARIFKYWHGGRRLSIPSSMSTSFNGVGITRTPQTTATGISTAQPFDLGVVSFQSLTVSPLRRAEIPWYSEVPFLCLRPASSFMTEPLLPSQVAINGSVDANCFMAGAEDFSYGFLLAPPNLPSP
jgi:hypothetical protein